MDLQNEFASVKVEIIREDGEVLVRVEDKLRDEVRDLKPGEVNLLTRLRADSLDSMLPY